MTARLYILRKIRWTLSHRDALTLLQSTILPYIDLGNPFYSCANQNSFKAIQTLQNRALRIVYRRKEWPGTDIARTESRLLHARKRWIFFLLKHAHQLSYNAHNLRWIPNRNLRSNNNLYLRTTLPKSRKFEKSFVYQSIRIWNLLSNQLKNNRNFKSFKTRVKLELLHNEKELPWVTQN